MAKRVSTLMSGWESRQWCPEISTTIEIGASAPIFISHNTPPLEILPCLYFRYVKVSSVLVGSNTNLKGARHV